MYWNFIYLLSGVSDYVYKDGESGSWKHLIVNMLDKWGRSTESYPRVREYFDKKTIFITGASGFIGRVLIEKLLRSCPGIRRMYILLRPKKGLSTKERVDKLFSVEASIFDFKFLKLFTSHFMH